MLTQVLYYKTKLQNKCRLTTTCFVVDHLCDLLPSYSWPLETLTKSVKAHEKRVTEFKPKKYTASHNTADISFVLSEYYSFFVSLHTKLKIILEK